jgi:hypothetical protein
MKKNINFTWFILAVFLCTFAFSTTTPSAYASSPITDINGHWAQSQIEYLTAQNIIAGYPDGTFQPDKTITRAEFVKAIVMTFKLEIKEGKVFSDTSNHWAKDYIATANAFGIANGYSNDLFGPDNWISREQMAVMLVKAAELENIATGKVFFDDSKISAWAKNAVSIASGNNIIVGYPDNTFKPQGSATRAEAAIVLYRVINMQVAPIPIPVPTPAVNLGTAGNYAILAKTGISSIPASAITGNIGVSPIAAVAITGFSLTADATNVFSTSPQVIGKIYASDYASPTPSNLTTAVSDMETAYTDAAGRAVNYTELYTGDISGQTLTAGVYKWGNGVLINSDVILQGGATDVWIFQIGEGITQANGTRIILTGGAQAKNIFWQSAETVAIGTGAHFEGIILGKTAITLGTNASINGRLLAQTAVTLDMGTVVAPE